MEDQEIVRIEDTGGPKFVEYLRVIWGRKWLVLTVALAVFGVSTWRTLRQEPVYEAAATMQLGGATGPAVLERVGSFMSLPGGLETEMEILKSRVVAEKTAIRLQRHYELKTVPPGVSVVLRGVAVGDEARPGLYTIDFTDASGNYQVKDPTAQVVGVGQLDQPFKAGDLSFTISAKPVPGQGSSFQVLVRNPTAIANSLRGRLSVTLVRGTSIIGLKTRANDAKEASRITNAFAETYVDFSREQRLQQVLSMRTFIEKQIKTFRQDMIKTQEEFIGKTPASRLGLVRKGQEVEMSVDDPRVILARRLFDLELQRATLQYTLTPNHRVMAQVDREIATIRSRLAEEFRQTKQDMGLQDLMRETGLQISMYNYLLQRQQEARLAEASELGSARIIDRALTPTAPISPDVSGGVRIGLLLGLSLGMGVALLLAYLDRSIKNIEQLENRLGLPVFAGIPNMLEKSRRFPFSLSNGGERSNDAKILVAINGVKTPAAEAYRRLRTNIELALPEASARVFLFTSAGPGEGKSLTVANLAIIMTQTGKRVLLIDADFRRPAQHKLFGFNGKLKSGLADVLSKELLWRDVTSSSGVDNLDLLRCGRVPPNPVELLGGGKMKAVMQEVREHYDLVLVDSPPLLLYSDAVVLSPLVSGVFLVVRAGVTPPETIIRSRAMLDAVNAKLIGAVLNGISSADAFGPYGAYYYRYYSYDEDHAEDRGKIRKTLRRLGSHFRI